MLPTSIETLLCDAQIKKFPLAGETRDTAELGLIGAFLSDNLVPRNERVKLFRTWGSAMGMLPIGGPDIWGNTTWAPDDTPEMAEQNISYG